MRHSPPPRTRPPESTPGSAKNFGPGLSKPPGPFVADAGTRQRTGAETKGQESIMTATYTWDVFSSLDGYGSHNGDWGGYWGKQGPELLDRRLALYDAKQRMVFGPNTYRAHAQMLASSTEESEARDPWVTRMRNLPMTVVSTTLQGPLDWPDATLVSGDAVDVVAGLVDRVQVTIFPVITGQTGLDPIFQGAADFDLELIESRTLDGNVQELIYRPTLHV